MVSSGSARIILGAIRGSHDARLLTLKYNWYTGARFNVALAGRIKSFPHEPPKSRAFVVCQLRIRTIIRCTSEMPESDRDLL